MLMEERRSALLIAGMTVVSLAAFTGVALSPGCTDQPCTIDELRPNTPTTTFECASGDVCYQGQCIKACSAGQERSQECDADSQCSGALGQCVDGFCSACAQGEYCVPTLDICRPVEELNRPDEPTPPDSLVGRRPVDGGMPSGGIQRIADAGVMGPVMEAEVTHAAYIDISETRNVLGGSATLQPGVMITSFNVDGLDVGGLRWRADLLDANQLPRIQCEDEDENRDGCDARSEFASGDCTLRPLRSVMDPEPTPTPASLGEILITDHPDFPNSLIPGDNVETSELRATFSGAGYQLSSQTPLPGAGLLAFSEMGFNQRFLQVTGTGADGVTASAWPNPPGGNVDDVLLHVPYRLEPTAETLSQLQAPIVVGNPVAADLLFQWDRIDSGTNSFERVVVRVPAGDHELYCSAVEGQNGSDSIIIRADILNEMRMRAGDGDYDLYFERTSIQRPQVNPAVEADAGAVTSVDVTIRIRHTLRGRLTLQP